MAELSTGGLSPEAVRAIDMATVIAHNAGHRVVTPDHLATALLKQGDGLASRLLRTHFGVDVFELRTRLEAGLRSVQETFTPGGLIHRYAGEPFEVAPPLARIVERAKQLAVQQHKPVAGTDHLLAALLEEDTPATATFVSAGIAAAGVEAASADVPLPPAMAARHGPVPQGGLGPAIPANPTIAAGDSPSPRTGGGLGTLPPRYSRDVGSDRGSPTAIASTAANPAIYDLVAQSKAGAAPPVAERPPLLEQLAGLLVQPGTSVVLVGEPGVGRRSLIRAFAQLLARESVPGVPAALWAVSPAALLDGPELVIRQGLEAARGATLALPDLPQFFGGSPLTGFAEAGVALRQGLLEGQVRLIGTATQAQYTRYLEGDPVLRDHLRPLPVPPASESETLAALHALKPSLERAGGVSIADSALQTAYTLSRQYLPDPQPSAAVALLQRGCALVRLSGTALFGPHPLPPAGAGNPASPTRGERESVAPQAADTTVDDADVAQALHQQTGIPMGQIAGVEQDRLARMEELLHQRVVGQDAAITALARAVRRARAGLKDPKRPIGSFLFLGPSGVGKTESALALAEFLFGTEDAVVTLNMSEYMEKHTVARLIGAPPGYVGFEEGGQLTERVRQKPYAVVLLDEVEKAHPDVYDIFLQVLDQGQLQDSRGRTVSFRNTVVVMTSNLGGRALISPETLPPGVSPKDAVLQAVRDHFRPEFLNRLDGIIVFDPLDRAALGKILDLMLGKLAKQLAAQGISLQVTAEAKEWLLDQHHEPEYGARPLNRIVQSFVKDAISERLIDGTLTPGQKIVATLKDGALAFTNA